MITYTIRCTKCNYSYTPKSNKIPPYCPNCGKQNTLSKEGEHLAQIIDLD